MRKALKSLTRDIITVLFLCICIFVAISKLVAEPSIVRGNSMIPEIYEDQIIITDKFFTKSKNIERGDIVLFRDKSNGDKTYVKRVVGLPKETIKLEEGKIYVGNGSAPDLVPLNEDYLKTKVNTFSGEFLKEGYEIVIPPGKYILLGDNRNLSIDSRHTGFVDKADIMGKVVIVVWPPKVLRT